MKFPTRIFHEYPANKIIVSTFLCVLLSGLFVLITAYSQQNQLNINRASFEEIQQLPISQEASEKIYEYILFYGGFRSIYDLRKIEEISAQKFEEIKPMVRIAPPESLG
ncbi:MAG: helix-hairpin-helix domain-containing protein, partial [Candidatus Latescibacteria bacterium]|nr:helix-hairpin-helix domain-containing protein [Candidatus Latescibacterota bacterium]